VSTISDDPPALNWVFVDKDSHLIRHGSRGDTLGGHTIGPWKWSNDELWLTLEGRDAQFVAVKQENKKWAVAWDGDGSIRSARGWDDDDDNETEGGDGPKRLKWPPLKLCLRLQLGMESSYIRKGEKEGRD
jgi:hypothetical protein